MCKDLRGNTTKKIPPMQTPRSRLLLSCGESIQAMARSAYQRVETMRCPVGCVARGVSRVATPILSPLQLRCFSALSFVDRQLLVVQDVATVLFPCSERVFSKADDLVLLVESLPARFDGAIDGLEALVAGVKSGAAGARLFVPPKRRRRRRRRAEEEDGSGCVFRGIWCDAEEGASLHLAMAGEVEKNCSDVARKFESLDVATAGGGGRITGDTVHSEGEASSAKRGNTSGGEECAGEDVQGVEANAAEIVETMQGTEIAKADTLEAAAREGGSSESEEATAIAMGGRASREDALLDLFDAAWQQKLV
ncbi:hypothetical protein ABZP36_004253 [Zizania latifolia]